MTTRPSSAIGPYIINRELGRGGMGVVFLATDTRLDRQVALKALPADLAADPDRLARFEREAKLLAALNHPNIAAIYGLEQADGHRYLVLEFVDGETLSQRLRRGPLPLDEALQIATQIAQALEAAHEKSIVHRDLKPGNIMVTAEGLTKVLDFGLARAAESAASSTGEAALANAPTVTSPARDYSPTIPGAIMGTAGYMSPEQARGKPIDKRSDIFSFGCVLYEMLTGAGPFPGETLTDSLGAILHREPDWTRLPPQTPARIRDLLAGCLAKDKKNRRRDIGDVRLELDRAIDAKEWLTTPAIAPSARPTSRIAARAAAILAALALIAATWWAATRWSHAPIPQPPMTSTLIASQADDYSSAFQSAVSPNGKSVAFRAINEKTGRPSLWVRPIDSFTARPLPQTEGGLPARPFWSPDSKSLAYFDSGNLYAVDVEQTGARRLLAPIKGSTFGGSWSSDGTILVVNTGDEYRIWSVPASAGAGGSPAALTRIDAPSFESMHASPHFLPDGKHFLYVAIIADPSAPEGRQLAGRLFAGKLGSNEKTLVGNMLARPWFVEPGTLVYVEDGTIKAVPFDAAALKITGEPVVLADGVRYYGGNGDSSLSVSRDGTIVYEPIEADDQMMWLDLSGKPVATIGPRGAISNPRISPDGSAVAATIRDPRTGNADIWVFETSRPIATRLTSDPRDERNPAWSHDGSRVYFSAVRGANFDVYSMTPDGAGPMQHTDLGPLPTGGQREWYIRDASLDGKYLMAWGYFDKSNADLRAVPLANPAQAAPFRSSPAIELEARFSPDGKWVVFTSNETQPSQVYLSSFPEHGPKVQLSEFGASRPFWSPKGDKVYFISLARNDAKSDSSDNQTVLLGVDLTTPESFKSPPKPQVVFESPDQLSNIEIAPDSKRFLAVRTQPGTPPIHVIINGLRR